VLVSAEGESMQIAARPERFRNHKLHCANRSCQIPLGTVMGNVLVIYPARFKRTVTFNCHECGTEYTWRPPRDPQDVRHS
jgi:hypothetical protein